MSYRTSITIYSPTPPWEYFLEDDEDYTEPTEDERAERYRRIGEITDRFLNSEDEP